MSLTLAAAPYVVIDKAAELTGYTRRAIEEKIAKGIWLEGREWVKAPDGRRLISMEGYAQWAESEGASMSARRASGSRSRSTASSSDRP